MNLLKRFSRTAFATHYVPGLSLSGAPSAPSQAAAEHHPVDSAQPAPGPESPKPLLVEDLLAADQAGTLAELDDATLHRAVIVLETAARNFFTGIDTSSWTVSEVSLGRRLKQRYGEVANRILKLLATRYGCND